jgi:hypothetical protein
MSRREAFRRFRTTSNVPVFVGFVIMVGLCAMVWWSGFAFTAYTGLAYACMHLFMGLRAQPGQLEAPAETE